jgi:hypothetical protein
MIRINLGCHKPKRVADKQKSDCRGKLRLFAPLAGCDLTPPRRERVRQSRRDIFRNAVERNQKSLHLSVLCETHDVVAPFPKMQPRLPLK